MIFFCGWQMKRLCACNRQTAAIPTTDEKKKADSLSAIRVLCSDYHQQCRTILSFLKSMDLMTSDSCLIMSNPMILKV